MPTGRPSEYNAEVAALICERIGSGDSIRTICAEEGSPSIQTIFNWLGKHPDFVEQYTRAREMQMEAMAEEILQLADSADAETYNPKRLQVDTRKWLMSKMAPKKYGDSTTLKGDQNNPLSVQYVAKSILDKGE